MRRFYVLAVCACILTYCVAEQRKLRLWSTFGSGKRGFSRNPADGEYFENSNRNLQDIFGKDSKAAAKEEERALINRVDEASRILERIIKEKLYRLPEKMDSKQYQFISSEYAD